MNSKKSKLNLVGSKTRHIYYCSNIFSISAIKHCSIIILYSLFAQDLICVDKIELILFSHPNYLQASFLLPCLKSKPNQHVKLSNLYHHLITAHISSNLKFQKFLLFKIIISNF